MAQPRARDRADGGLSQWSVALRRVGPECCVSLGRDQYTSDSFVLLATLVLIRGVQCSIHFQVVALF